MPLRAPIVLRPALLASLVALTGCIDPDEPGALVPPTVVDDPDLPQVEVTVAGRVRSLHLETLGDPEDPPLLFVHGTFSDYRALRRLGVALADRYHVVLWDQRGAGLSERIEDEEFSLQFAVDEIEAVRSIFAPDTPVTLFGHSWGGALAALYISEHPDAVRQAILAEPMPLDGALMNERVPELVQFSYFNEVWNDQARLDDLLAAGDHERLDYRAAMTLDSGVTNYFCDPEDPPDYPIWRVGGHLELLRGRVLLDGRRFDYRFDRGLDAFPTPVLILGGACGALGAEFQEANAERFVDARVVEIPDAGHRLTVEAPQAVLTAARAYLEAYR